VTFWTAGVVLGGAVVAGGAEVEDGDADDAGSDGTDVMVDVTCAAGDSD
jgi:hypothetical protein